MQRAELCAIYICFRASLSDLFNIDYLHICLAIVAKSTGTTSNMPSNGSTKSRASKAGSAATSPTAAKPFVRKDYYASLAYHLCLLFGAFLLLPRTRSSYVSRWGLGGAAQASDYQTTSADRPEHPWLTPITANPTRTLVWHLIGEVVVMLMWGQHLVSLSGAKRVADKQQRVAANLQVSSLGIKCTSLRAASELTTSA